MVGFCSILSSHTMKTLDSDSSPILKREFRSSLQVKNWKTSVPTAPLDSMIIFCSHKKHTPSQKNSRVSTTFGLPLTLWTIQKNRCDLTLPPPPQIPPKPRGPSSGRRRGIMGAFQAWKNSKGAGLPHGWLPPRWGAVGMIFSFFSGKQKKIQTQNHRAKNLRKQKIRGLRKNRGGFI